jgi:hypothetical protein
MSDNRALARTAASQYGLLTLAQNEAGGVTRRAVAHRRDVGRYERIARGVDAIAGTPASWERQVAASWLAAGDRAVVSHRTAAHLWGIGTFDAVIDLSVPYRRAVTVPGAAVHRSLDLQEGDCQILRGIWITSVARTLVDVGAVVPLFLLELLIERALGRGLTTPIELRAMLERVAKKGRRGAGRLRTVLDERALGDQLTDSEIEEMFGRVCRDIGAPIPTPQVWVEVGGKRRRLDFAWVARMVAAEINGYADHSRRLVFEDDHERRNSLIAAGWTVPEFTRRQLLRDRPHIRRTLQAVL